MKAGDIIIPFDRISNLSDEDVDGYMRAITEAFSVYVERELIRDGLWKKYPAADQTKQIKIKAERVLHALDITRPPDDTSQIDVMLEELDDIINYAVFAKRIIRGEIA